MKSILPWFCLMTVANIEVAIASEGVDAYREGHYVKAAEAFEQLKQRDPIVNYYMGRMRLYGYGQLKNNALAIRHFEEAGTRGLLPAQQWMARYALLVKNDPEEALHWFKKAAASDDVSAQLYCSAAYLFGFGVKKNDDVAKQFLIPAAKNGDALAQYALAKSFLETRQLSNKKLGLIWLNKAVDRQNPKAQVLLSQIYLEGKLVDRDVTKAIDLAQLAAQQGYAPAWVQLGDIALSESKLEDAKQSYMKAVEAKYQPAAMRLSELCLKKDTPLYSPQESINWLLKAAQVGYAPAQSALAEAYRTGQGVEANPSLAEQWASKYDSTKKQKTNIEQKMVRWLTNNQFSSFKETGYRLTGIFSAWQNPSVLKENRYNPAPQMDRLTRVSLYQPNLKMTDPNTIPFSEYYNALVSALQPLNSTKHSFPRYPLRLNTADTKAVFKKLHSEAILGNSAAQFRVAQMYARGVGVEKNMESAVKYYRLAATQQDLRAAYELGLIYLLGEQGEPNYKLAKSILTDAAFKGSTPAQYVIASLEEQGYQDAAGNEVIPENRAEAISMYQLAAAGDDGPAQYRLAEILVREKPSDLSRDAVVKRNQTIKSLYQGAVQAGIKAAVLPLAFFNAMESDPAKQAEAFASAKKIFDAGQTQAALLLGLLYDRGIGVEANHKTAINYYQKVKDNPIAAFALGTYMSDGKGISKDDEQSRRYLQQAADAGFSYAYLNLAIQQKENKDQFLAALAKARSLGNRTASILLADYAMSLADSDEQMKQAREIYQELAAQGDQDGQLKLGYLLEHGLGGRVDLAEAQDLYERAAQQGQPMAQYLLARSYQLGWSTQPDYALAKKWYTAAQGKYAPAAVALGFIYDTVDDDYQHAQAGYQQAAQAGDVIGEYNLAVMYEEGKGQAVDPVKAREWYEKAVSKNHSQSMVQLAGLYLNGTGVSRNEKQARELYKKAAEMGNRNALYELGLLSEKASKPDYPTALRYYKQASEKGNEKAMLALARFYQYGLGVPKDTQQAIELYRTLSRKNGNMQAKQILERLEAGGSQVGLN